MRPLCQRYIYNRLGVTIGEVKQSGPKKKDSQPKKNVCINIYFCKGLLNIIN